MVVCGHCGNTVWWDAEAVHNVGRRSILPEGFTRLYTGATGALLDRRIRVIGRVRFGYGRGFWDEWYLEYANGGHAWLTEDDHELCLQQPSAPAGRPPSVGQKPGQRFNHQGEPWVVEEVGVARCLGVEGALPEKMEEGESFRYVDASSPDGRRALGIEDWEGDIRVYVGRWLLPGGLVLDDEGERAEARP